MDNLRSWFDGGDLIAIVLALIAATVSIWTTWRQSRTDTLAIDLQQRLTDIEVARRAEEIARTTEADVRVSLRRERSDFDDRWDSYLDSYLDIENRGGATAHNVNLESFRERSSGSDVMVPEHESHFPVSEMIPGHTITCSAFFVSGAGTSFEAVVTWDDPRGSQRRTMPVTR